MAQHPLRLKTLPAAIVDRLRQDILGGAHGPGSPLRQDAIALAYGVSRIPVREALRQLEAEGLVELVPHKGAVVTPLSQEEVGDVLELRAILEPRLLERSAPRLTPEDFAGLDATQAAYAEAIAGGDRARWGALNAELHRQLYQRADLPRTQAIVAGLLQTSERYTRLQLTTGAALARAQDEHGRLIALCRAGEREAAVDLLRAHIAGVRQDLEALLATSPSPGRA